MSQAGLERLAAELGEALARRGWMFATAESCTGGWAAQAITAVAGSSGWFERGFVTYSDPAKVELLGVRQATLDRFGAVSEETVREMAEGAMRHSRAQMVVAISGIAGPGGATPGKPVGTVFFAFAAQAWGTETARKHFPGDRREVRTRSVDYAFRHILARLSAMP